MAHLTYEQSKSKAFKVISILGLITIFEVMFALAGKGYIIDGLHFPVIVMALVMIILSLVKAYLIVYEFMHMKYEVPGLVKTVLLPTLLLVWAIIAFFYEGNGWNVSRKNLIEKYHQKSEMPAAKDVGTLNDDTFPLG